MQGQNDNLKMLCESIIIPATRLADSVQLSSTQYQFDKLYDENPILNMEDQPVEVLKMWKVIDMISRKTVKPNSPVTADGKGLIGRPIILLEPGLYRSSGQVLELRPPTVVFRFNQAIRRQSGN